jgi:hypothetical protein
MSVSEYEALGYAGRWTQVALVVIVVAGYYFTVVGRVFVDGAFEGYGRVDGLLFVFGLLCRPSD